jgi:hypothetical protein
VYRSKQKHNQQCPRPADVQPTPPVGHTGSCGARQPRPPCAHHNRFPCPPGLDVRTEPPAIWLMRMDVRGSLRGAAVSGCDQVLQLWIDQPAGGGRPSALLARAQARAGWSAGALPRRAPRGRGARQQRRSGVATAVRGPGLGRVSMGSGRGDGVAPSAHACCLGCPRSVTHPRVCHPPPSRRSEDACLWIRIRVRLSVCVGARWWYRVHVHR